MTADEIIKTLGLAEHPEGGWFRETWRAEAAPGKRAATAAAKGFEWSSGERRF